MTASHVDPDGTGIAPASFADVRHAVREILGRRRRLVVEAFMASLLAGGLFLVFPSTVGLAVDVAQGRGSVTTLVVLITLNILAAPTLTAWQRATGARLGHRVCRDVVDFAVTATLRLDHRDVERLGGDRLASRVVNDTVRVEELLSEGLPAIVLLALQLVCSMVFLAVLGPVFAAVLLVTVIANGVALRIFLPRSRRVETRLMDADADCTADASMLAAGARQLAAAGLLDDVVAAAEEHLVERRRVAGVARRMRAVYFVAESASGSLLVVLPLISLWLWPGRLGVESSTAAAAAALGVSISALLSEAAFWSDEAQLCSLALGRIVGLQSYADARDGARSNSGRHRDRVCSAPSCAGATPGIHAEGVGFAFGATRVLADVDLHLPPRGNTAVVGRSGAGKTTLMRIIGGLLPADSGTVHLGDADGRCLPAGCVIHATQEPHVFAVSLADNISLGDASVDVGNVLGGAVFPSLVGLDLGQVPDPGSLSPAQVRDISLSRIVARQPGIALFDESFAGLDAQGVRRVLELLPGTTTVSIVHDAAILPAFDRVIEIDDDGRARIVR